MNPNSNAPRKGIWTNYQQPTLPTLQERLEIAKRNFETAKKNFEELFDLEQAKKNIEKNFEELFDFEQAKKNFEEFFDLEAAKIRLEDIFGKKEEFQQELPPPTQLPFVQTQYQQPSQTYGGTFFERVQKDFNTAFHIPQPQYYPPTQFSTEQVVNPTPGPVLRPLLPKMNSQMQDRGNDVVSMMRDQLSKLALKPNKKTPVRRSGAVRKSTKGGWTPEEDTILRTAVLECNGKNWKRISEHLKDRSPIQCLHRWQKVLNPTLVKGPWTPEEDSLLIELVKQIGTENWSMIASKLQGRIGKQCRERWYNHLDPNIRKDPFSKDEEEILLEAHARLGNKWSEISQLLPGRTDNQVKNHYHSYMYHKEKGTLDIRDKKKVKLQRPRSEIPLGFQVYVKQMSEYETYTTSDHLSSFTSMSSPQLEDSEFIEEDIHSSIDDHTEEYISDMDLELDAIHEPKKKKMDRTMSFDARINN